MNALLLSIVYADARVAVIDKPAGLLSVPGKGPEKQDCAASRVAAMYPSATGPLVVHRLDMETSGLLVFGLDAAAQRDLSRQFEERTVEKAYVSLVDGLVDGDEGEIDLPIRADIDNRPLQIVDHERGRAAVTRWRVLARETDRTRVEFVPRTGRTHQIRLHASAGLGHAIMGDVLYGGSSSSRLMLHAARLSVLDPESGRRMDFECATPF